VCVCVRAGFLEQKQKPKKSFCSGNTEMFYMHAHNERTQGVESGRWKWVVKVGDGEAAEKRKNQLVGRKTLKNDEHAMAEKSCHLLSYPSFVSPFSASAFPRIFQDVFPKVAAKYAVENIVYAPISCCHNVSASFLV